MQTSLRGQKMCRMLAGCWLWEKKCICSMFCELAEQGPEVVRTCTRDSQNCFMIFCLICSSSLLLSIFPSVSLNRSTCLNDVVFFFLKSPLCLHYLFIPFFTGTHELVLYRQYVVLATTYDFWKIVLLVTIM